jgi:peroxiredoxin
MPGIRPEAALAGQDQPRPLIPIQSAPEFFLQNVLGGEIHSRDLKGKVVVVEFWANFAVPSRTALLESNQLRKALKDQAVEFLAVTFESGSATQVAQAVKELQIEFPVVMATADVDKAFGGHFGYPTTFLIGKDWKVYRKIFGQPPNRTQTLQWEIQSLLAMPPSEPQVTPVR